MIGESIGSYTITRLLGEGGMGLVYLAEHKLIGRKAAIKVLHAKQASDREVLDRFFTEARVGALVKHPGIVDVFDYGHLPSGAAFIVMDYLEGESLAARLKEGHAIGPATAVEVARQVAVALGAAHAAGIIHRDLKPDNIFLVPSDEHDCGFRAKVLDFGIAKLVGPASSKAAVTQPGMIFGTPYYMSPEQCRALRDIDGRADMYALGCVLHEMLSGNPPFLGDSPMDVVVGHMSRKPVPLRQIVPTLPEELERLVLRLLAKAPADRGTTATDLADELERLGRALPVSQAAPPSIRRRKPVLTLKYAGPVDEEGPTAEDALATGKTAGGPLGAQARTVAAWRNWRTLALTRRSLVLGGVGIAGLSLVGLLLAAPWRSSVQAPPPPVPDMAPAPVAAPPPPPDAAVGQVHLTLASDPSGATIYREGTPIGQTPTVLDAPRDSEMIPLVLRLPGHEEASFTFIPIDDRIELVKLEKVRRRPVKHAPKAPEKLPAVPRPGQVRLTVRSTPAGATVLRDGASVGTTPTAFDVPRSRKRLRLVVKAEGFIPQNVSLERTQDSTATVRLMPVTPRAATEARLHERMGDAHLKAGNLPLAVQEYEAAQAQMPQSEILFKLGKAYRRKGDARKALVNFRQYLVIDPDGPYAREAATQAAQLVRDLHRLD